MKNLHLLQNAIAGTDTVLHRPAGRQRQPSPAQAQKDERLFEFVARFIAEHGYTPSSREIMLGTGVSSTSVVWYAVQRLIATGRLVKASHSPRSLHLASPDGYIYKPLDTALTKQIVSAARKWVADCTNVDGTIMLCPDNAEPMKRLLDQYDRETQ